MAILTEKEKAQVRNFIEKKSHAAGVPVSWSKAAVNAAAQAIEDLEDGSAPILATEISGASTSLLVIGSARIDAATAPFSITFLNQEKKWLRAKVLEKKFFRDAV